MPSTRSSASQSKAKKNSSSGRSKKTTGGSTKGKGISVNDIPEDVIRQILRKHTSTTEQEELENNRGMHIFLYKSDTDASFIRNCCKE